MVEWAYSSSMALMLCDNKMDISHKNVSIVKSEGFYSTPHYTDNTDLASFMSRVSLAKVLISFALKVNTLRRRARG